jgi:hypothetical protein
MPTAINEHEEGASILNLAEKAPMRPPDWRWERARIARADPRIAAKLRKTDDNWIANLKIFQKAYSDCSSSLDFLVLAEEWPMLAQVVNIEFTRKPIVKYGIQASLLANEAISAIAYKAEVEPEVIIWYEKTFFNVLDRLARKRYIFTVVMGESLQRGMTARDYDLLWKFYGYIGGPCVLDAVVGHNFEPQKPENAEHSESFSSDDTRHANLINSMIASRTMPINSYTQQAILEIHQKYLELKSAAESGGANDMILINIQKAMLCLPWVVGPSAKIIDPQNPENKLGELEPKLLEVDGWAGELRSGDLLELGRGNKTDNLERIRNTKFPDQQAEEPAEEEVAHS